MVVLVTNCLEKRHGMQTVVIDYTISEYTLTAVSSTTEGVTWNYFNVKLYNFTTKFRFFIPHKKYIIIAFVLLFFMHEETKLFLITKLPYFESGLKLDNFPYNFNSCCCSFFIDYYFSTLTKTKGKFKLKIFFFCYLYLSRFFYLFESTFYGFTYILTRFL